MSTASYRHLIVNKENPSTATTTAACLQENVTGSALSNTVPRRRALGDVLNTAISNRPPVGLTPAKTGLKFISSTSNNTPAKQHLQTPSQRSQTTATDAVTKTPAAHQLDLLPPVERFIPPPIDTFDDVFEDNLRLTDIFLGAGEQQPPAAVKFIGRLPCLPSAFLEDNKLRLDDATAYDLESDKETRRQLKRRNKSIKRSQQQVPSASDIQIFSDSDKDLSPVRELELTDSDLENL